MSCRQTLKREIYCNAVIVIDRLSCCLKKVTIQCFGEFRLCLDGRDQSGVINSGKIEELLAYLLLQDGKYVNKKRVAAALWPQLETERGMDNLYKNIKKLQRLCADNLPLQLEVIPEKLRLDLENVESDIIIFEKLCGSKRQADLQQALKLYQGQLFEWNNYEWCEIETGYYDWLFLSIRSKLYA